MSELTVVGICTYNPAVQRWLRTLRVHFDGPCRLYLVNSPKELQSVLAQKFHCDVIDVQVTPDYWAAPSPGRFCRVWGCLADACLEHISTSFVLRTDVWDVVFQGDPRLHLNPPPNKILVASESVSLNEDNSNRGWLGSWHRIIPHGSVVNGGMICGRTTDVAVVAKILDRNPFGTAFDQSELIILRNIFDEQFEYRSGFMETIYKTLQVSGAVEQGLFVNRSTGKPWCIVHGNGSTKPLLDSHYPITEADRTIG